MKLLIALYHPFDLWTAPAWFVERLRTDFPDLTVKQLPGPRYEGIEREIADADIAIAFSIRPEQFAHAQRLRWIHSPAAAVHQLLYPAMVASDVVVTNAREVHGNVVAEHALAVTLALAKRLPSAFRYQQQKLWSQRQLWNEIPPPRELEGATVCVVGAGSIGTAFIRRAKALGMHVLVVREHPELGGAGADEAMSTTDLPTALPRAAFVVLAAALTPGTRHIINSDRLCLMRKDAYLVNVSRGPLIDDDALIAALQNRQIAGAALDVFVEEPLPPDSPYWALDHVLITPHTAAVTEKLWERHYAVVRENLRRFLADQPLLYVVNKKQGY